MNDREFEYIREHLLSIRADFVRAISDIDRALENIERLKAVKIGNDQNG